MDINRDVTDQNRAMNIDGDVTDQETAINEAPNTNRSESSHFWRNLGIGLGVSAVAAIGGALVYNAISSEASPTRRRIHRVNGSQPETSANVEKCSVCCDNFASYHPYPCGHSFCCKCLDSPEKNPTCPICRHKFKSVPEAEKCIICCDNLASSYAYPCGHPFCCKCLYNPEISTCPICRGDIRTVLP